MSEVDTKELDRMLSEAFEAASKIYQERGFQRRVGFGKRPALVSVDLANAWTRPGNPFTCDQEKMDNEIIPGMQKLLAACRANGHPVIHVTTAYEITDRNAPFTDMGLWHNKIPVDVVNLADKELWAIDSRIAPVEGEYTLLKKRASLVPRHRARRHPARRTASTPSSSPASPPAPACGRRSATASPTASAPSR